VRTGAGRFNAHQEHTPSDETDKAITFINSQDLGWKADVCKLQKHHADYGDHCDHQNQTGASDPDNSQTLAQTDSEIDLDETSDHKTKDFSKASGKDFEEALKKAQTWS